ncbi:MAG: S8 family peptidase [Hyphomonadaceae bacterium]|nr:S8 family peptidase [Hyphomonadaceae bacterium]
MAKLSNSPSLATGLIALATGLLLAGCDRTDERIERAKSVTEAAVEQVAGGGAAPKSSGGTDMASVPVEARAVAGAMMDPEVVTASTDQPRSRFAIGSIIAKPRDLPAMPSPTEALIMQRPDLADELEAQSEAMVREELVIDDQIVEELEESAQAGDGSVERPLRDVLEARPQVRELRVAPRPGELSIPRALPPDQMKLARRAVVTDRAIEVQTDARALMLDTMTEFGLAGQVELTRTGQMVVQIGSDGADPTQFRDLPAREIPDLFTAEGAARPGLPRQALNADLRCPDNPNSDEMRRRPVLATQCMVERLAASGQFEYVEKDFIFDHQFIRRPEEPPVQVAVSPDDPLWELQWHFFNNGAGEGESPGGSGFVDFWTDGASTGSRDVVVAVVDTGLDMNHPDIVDSLNVAPGWDMVSDPTMGNDGDGRDPDAHDPGDLCDPTVPFAENSYHGTHVAGTIGAAVSDNAKGVAGGAWNVTVVPVRALGKCGGRLTDINDSIRWAGGLVPAFDTEGNEVWNENPADIINLSIGLFEFCPASLQEAINAVTERGVVVVSAAGNARVDTRFYSPGGCQNVVSVAAGDARGQIAPYSNYGDEVDILAPGGDLSRDDNGDGRPDGVLSTRLATNCFDPVTGDPVSTCYYAFEQGTSMAAPHVSAALALLKARDPALIGSSLSDQLMSALAPRTVEQCASPCDDYPGATPVEGNPDLCLRPCGGGLLDLGRAAPGD